MSGPLGRASRRLTVTIVDGLERAFAGSQELHKILLAPGFEALRGRVGAWRAEANFHRAYRTVPAYRRFIDEHGGKPTIPIDADGIPDLRVIPEMDKESYIKKYPIEQRLRGGVLPTRGVMVDESSGSSGKPTSWVRGPLERQMTKQMMRLVYHRSVDPKDKVFILNAFALGAWATGMNVSISLTNVSIVKSTGPNADKIVQTMLEFGPGYRYMIVGYPPFLKSLADDKRIDWQKYTVDAGYGGEGISEGLRSHLLKTFKRVVGSYGASDLEVNMAVETDLTIRLRRALGEDERLRAALIRTDYGVTPMIFQYNPLAYYLETNDKGELVATLSRPFNISPRIRYNIHDRGHALGHAALRRALAELGRDDIVAGAGPVAELPLLFLYGRSDMSIEYYGAKVTPDSIREILYGMEELAPVLSTFRLISDEDANHNKRMKVAIELTAGAVMPDPARIGMKLFTRLGAVNGDFYNAMNRTATADNMPTLELHAFETGPFAGGQRKLKNEYVASDLKYDRL
jgi:phenylacetate-CoA ligase